MKKWKIVNLIFNIISLFVIGLIPIIIVDGYLGIHLQLDKSVTFPVLFSFYLFAILILLCTYISKLIKKKID